MRPCGACRALVPADTGCQHWKPGRSAKAADSAARRRATRIERAERRAKADEERAAFLRMFRIGEATT